MKFKVSKETAHTPNKNKQTQQQTSINFDKQMFKLQGIASILKYQKHLKLLQKQFQMKDTGKSSSRKLRYVIYYTLYRMDPQKTH